MKEKSEKLIEFEYDATLYDASNPLVLTKHQQASENKTRAFKREGASTPKILSKKKRKELERKLAQKEKKLTRAELWKELEAVNKTVADGPKISVLPLFTQTKKLSKSKKASDKHIPKGKAWEGVSSITSDESQDTDDYSSDDSIVPDEIAKVASEFPAPSAVKTETCESRLVLPDVESVPRPARFVLVSRKPEVIAARLALPIISEETTIMEAINQHDCVIICGATGCGKTTQVPQFLYEAGYSSDGYMIGVTEPRRVAAISMSRRVGEELNLPPSKVSYHIRYEKTVAKDTEIKFMTDGVLLQEMKQDFELSRYSSVIVDEAHERTIYTDVLLGLLSMAVRLRYRRHVENRPTNGKVLPPLKLIIMSATLRVTDFSENRRLFPEIPSGPPPVVHVESRQFPVTCHFAKVTQPDYLKAAFQKVLQIHQNAPPGGILVFLTGQREVLTLCSWLSRAFPAHLKTESKESMEITGKIDRMKTDSGTGDINGKDDFSNVEFTESQPLATSIDLSVSAINLDNFDIIPADEESELERTRSSKPESSHLSAKAAAVTHAASYDGLENDELQEVDDDGDVLDVIASSRVTRTLQETPIYALPLYSLLSPERQQLVFHSPPEGQRLVVVATNVAETSLTIPNIRFVIDSGKVKTKVYDPATGASSFEVVWISQASAEQRAGRAGRVCPGQCHRLYSSQVFSSMQPFTTPDILTRPIDEVVLMLKYYLGSTPLSRFPLPTAPSSTAMEFAERRLVCLGALEELRDGHSVADSPFRTITRAGRWMCRLPLPARFARMLLFANQHNLMPYAVILVSALSVPELFVSLQSPQTAPVTDDQIVSATLTPDERFRSNFVQQFVRKRDDLYLGDLAILLGTVCCLERYWAQLTGLAPAEPGVLEACGGLTRISRDPDSALRFLVERCGVRWTAYKEVRQLRRQLTDILNANVPDLNLPLDPVIPRPSASQLNQLRQLFLVGSPCHLATKLDVPVEGLPAKDRRRLRYAYRVPGVAGAVFIDPNSPLARENCPFVAFLELHRDSKPYLRTVCAIDPKWIPFLAPNNYKVEGVVLGDDHSVCKESVRRSPNADESIPDGSVQEEGADHKKAKPIGYKLPTPSYDDEQDLVVTGAKSISYVGTCASQLDSGDTGEFELPNQSVVFPLNSSACSLSVGSEEALLWSVRWFSRMLLQGVVLKSFHEWFPGRIKRNLSPALLTVSWGVVRNEVRKLVSALVTHRIDSRRGLYAKWKTDPLYLSRELASWLQPAFVTEFHSRWPLVAVPEMGNI